VIHKDYIDLQAINGSLWTPTNCVDIDDRTMRVHYTDRRGLEILHVESREGHGDWQPDCLPIVWRAAVLQLIQQALDDADLATIEMDDAETERADSLGYHV